jgi:hypothetical protein
VPNEAVSTSTSELVKERPKDASCPPIESVDFVVPLTYEADSDENLRFQVQLVNRGIRPSGVSLLVHTDGYMPTDRTTEMYSDHAVDGVYSVTINVMELHYQLCKAANVAGATCLGVLGGNNASHVKTTVAAAAAGGADETAADLTYVASVKCSSADSASFKLLATAIKLHLVDGISIHGELCPGNFTYHHWEHQHIGGERSVRFRLTKHGGADGLGAWENTVSW